MEENKSNVKEHHGPIKVQGNLREGPFDDKISKLSNGKVSVTLFRPKWIWPGGIIPYKIDSSLEKKSKILKNIEQAIDEFRQKTPIKFEKISNSKPKDNGWVIFKYHESRTKSDEIGRKGEGKEQSVYVSQEKSKVGNIMHELMHVLGFEHEHIRIDKKDHVDIHEDKEDTLDVPKSNYEIDGYPIGKYDAKSLMHYPTNEYMTADDSDEGEEMGNRDGFSDGDLKCIEYAYGEPKCTFDHFGKEEFLQTFYECNTCKGDRPSYEICEFCASVHHKNHVLKKHDYGNREIIKKRKPISCDCGTDKHQVRNSGA
jgi:hypothetical protein